MMGREDPPQPSLFYTSFNLDKRVRSNHPLRKVSKVIDFGFVSDDVEHLYGYNGNVSVPPAGGEANECSTWYTGGRPFCNITGVRPGI